MMDECFACDTVCQLFQKHLQSLKVKSLIDIIVFMIIMMTNEENSAIPQSKVIVVTFNY